MKIVAVEPIGISPEKAQEIKLELAAMGHEFVFFPDRRDDAESLRDRMTSRVEATINYAYSDMGCRERMLLSYFGEYKADECGHCDLCIDRRKRDDHTPDDVQQGILYMAGQRPRRLEEFLDTLSFPKDEIISMLSFLVDEGYIEHLNDDTYRKIK